MLHTNFVLFFSCVWLRPVQSSEKRNYACSVLTNQTQHSTRLQIEHPKAQIRSRGTHKYGVSLRAGWLPSYPSRCTSCRVQVLGCVAYTTGVCVCARAKATAQATAHRGEGFFFFCALKNTVHGSRTATRTVLRRRNCQLCVRILYVYLLESFCIRTCRSDWVSREQETVLAPRGDKKRSPEPEVW